MVAEPTYREPRKSSSESKGRRRETKVLDISRARSYAAITETDESQDLLEEMRQRKSTKDAEQARFADNCDRWDNLYYPNQMSATGGPDHWPDDESAKVDGRSHISVNVYPTYVDVPAALQAVAPVENITPLLGEDNDLQSAREVAASVERAYFAWKEEVAFERMCHQACVVKGLYGRTAAKVFWNTELDRPEVTLVDQPRNLYLGWSSTDYKRLDWAMYCYRITPDSALSEFGVEVGHMDDNRTGPWPIVRRLTAALDNARSRITREWLHDYDFMVEVYDYWYRKPKPDATIETGKPTPMVTCNAIFVGNCLVSNTEYEEYDGRIPYVVLFNTYIPGVPDGRSEFYDIEQLIREKDERLSDAAQLVSRAVDGQYWQLTGPDAPDAPSRGQETLKPNKVNYPGAGNRYESVQPWMPTFQLEEFLQRIDRELVDVSGLNDLLRGLAPSAVMSSSKAITALVANYETRISMKRDLYYEWRVNVWNLVKTVWQKKNANLRPIFEAVGALEITNPSLTPRDDLETATMAANNVTARLWSQVRGMDAVGVDDPEGEADAIRSERTDAAMWPADVLTMVSLMAAMQQFQMTQQQMTAMMGQQAGGPMQGPGGAEAAMNAQGGGMSGTPMMNGEGEGTMTGGLPPAAPGQNFLSQTAVTPEGTTPRLLAQNPIQPEAEV